MIRKELGDDAVILSSRAAPGGIEVMAAIDIEPTLLKSTTETLPKTQAATYVRPTPGGTGEKKFSHLLDRRMKKKPTPKGEVALYRRRVIDAIPLAPLTPERHKPMVIALVGPTGVGKTTTCAKIAAWFKINHSLDVALMTTDCYRIGATEQLRTYARIMNMGCEVAVRPKRISTALDHQRKRDLVIIDTTGRSPYDRDNISELAYILDDERIMPILTLAATAKKEDIAATVSAYSLLAPRGVALTKLDETRAYAVMCRYLATAGLPVTCLGTGQRVPEDFHPGSREFLRDLFETGLPPAGGQHPEQSLFREARI